MREIPYKRFINYLPPVQQIGLNQRQVYRFSLNANDVLSVRLEPVSGDPDLYIWAPDHDTRPPWFSNLPNEVDDLFITAPLSGNYQVEVHGFSAAEYRLIVVINPTDVTAAESSGGQDPNIDVPSQPPLSNTNEPRQSAIDTSGVGIRFLYLPVISR